MDRQGLGNGVDILFSGVADVDPPDWLVWIWTTFMLLLEDMIDVPAREKTIPGRRGGRLSRFGRK